MVSCGLQYSNMRLFFFFYFFIITYNTDYYLRRGGGRIWTQYTNPLPVD